jgi:putative PIN family toxin of toxin-antitoxin system
MRVVVDTNIFVSAALKEISSPSAALHRIGEGDALLKSTVTERELVETLARQRFATLISARFREWVRELMAAAESVTITERIAACRDPKDDKFLELAVCGRADVIVSGDRDLLALDPFRQTPIVTPAAFMRMAG